MNKELAQKLLDDIISALDTGRYFIIDGTLLGAIREGDFIEHDLDMDIGVYAEDWDISTFAWLVGRLISFGIIPCHMYGNFTDHFEVACRRDGIKCDIFFYRRDDDKRIFHAYRNGGRNLPNDLITYEYDAGLIENIRPVFFRGKHYNAPADPVAVLVAKYGNDWKIPVKKWDWADGPLNQRKNDKR